MADIMLEDYERVERASQVRGARIGFIIHTVVTVLVWGALIPINVIVAPEFPWAVFPVAGMGLGVFLHWWFGYRDIETTVRKHQIELEKRALIALEERRPTSSGL